MQGDAGRVKTFGGGPTGLLIVDKTTIVCHGNVYFVLFCLIGDVGGISTGS